MSPAQAGPFGEHAVLFTQANASALAVGSSNLPTLIHSAPITGCGYYGYTYSYGSDSPSPPAPPPRAAGASTCYDGGYNAVPGCSCHASCATCGYVAMPTAPTDCLSCVSGGPVQAHHADGAGSCGPSVSPTQHDLKYGCYKACDAEDRFAAPAPPPGSGICANSCSSADDHYCDDGGDGAEYYFCPLGSDCADCGVRGAAPSKTDATSASPPPVATPRPAPSASPAGTCIAASLTDGTVAGCANWCSRQPLDNCLRCDCATCGFCLQPPSPPSRPPMPPNAPGGAIAHTVLILVRVTGVVSDYDEATLENIKVSIARAAGVEPSAVSVTIEAGSVLLTIVISASSASESSAMANTLRAKWLASPSLASDLLGVTVESVESLEAQAYPTIETEDGGLSGGAIAGIVVGVVVGVLLVALLAFLACRTKAAGNYSAGKDVELTQHTQPAA